MDLEENNPLEDVALDVIYCCCVVIYFNDILVFSENKDDHTSDVREVLGL